MMNDWEKVILDKLHEDHRNPRIVKELVEELIKRHKVELKKQNDKLNKRCEKSIQEMNAKIREAIEAIREDIEASDGHTGYVAGLESALELFKKFNEAGRLKEKRRWTEKDGTEKIEYEILEKPPL